MEGESKRCRYLEMTGYKSVYMLIYFLSNWAAYNPTNILSLALISNQVSLFDEEIRSIFSFTAASHCFGTVISPAARF